MVEAGLSAEVFRPDQKIENGRVVLPALLSGALDDKNHQARWLVPEHIPETVEEVRLAINGILAPEVTQAAPLPQLATAQI